MRINFIYFMFIALIISSCEQSNTDPEKLIPGGKGLFILNEGNYLAGNGSLSFYSLDHSGIYNDLFTLKNARPLGDIPSFLAIDGNRGFIIVNNSGTIEVVDMQTIESLGTITGLNSPRQMVMHGRKGYVSSLASDVITIINLETLTVTGTIDVGCSSEAMVITGEKLLAASWAGGDKVVVIDLLTDTVVDYVTTGLEPESMVLDKNNNLWVLCTGGYMNEEKPRLLKINTYDLGIEMELEFRTVYDNPSSLTINPGGDTLYFIDEGIRRMPVLMTSLPSDIMVPLNGRLFYRLAASPWNGVLCVTDAIDYQQKGDLLVYDKNGNLIDTEQAGIIPGFIRFASNDW